MRAAPLTLALLALLLTTATAQEDACSQSEPCPWSLDVDEEGIVGDDLVATVGDWYVLDLLNFDDREHTLTLEGHDVEVTLPPGGSATSEPFELDTPGTFSLSLEDQPDGDFVWVEVRETDVVDDQTGGDGGEDEDAEGQGTPLPLAVGLVAVLAAVVLRRR